MGNYIFNAMEPDELRLYVKKLIAFKEKANELDYAKSEVIEAYRQLVSALEYAKKIENMYDDAIFSITKFEQDIYAKYKLDTGMEYAAENDYI